MSYSDFDVDKARELREKAKDSFVRQFRRDFVTSVAVSLPILALIGYAAMKWGQATEPGLRISFSILYLLGALLGLVIWVVHGLTARLLFVTKEIKQLRLDFLSSQELPPEQATGGAESFMTWVSLALRPRLLASVLVGIVLLVSAVTCTVYGGRQLAAQDAARRINRTYDNGIYEDWRAHSFGGQEEAEVHFTPDGLVRVFSRSTITRLPDFLTPVPVRIGQPGATVESVTLNGKKTLFVAVPGMKDTYSAMPGVPENALKDATMEVVWSIPVAAMGFDGNFGCKFRLLGIIPVNNYVAKAIIDDGAPYQFAISELAGTNSYSMFTATLGDYEAGEMGYCGIKLHYVLLEGQTR